MTAAGWFVSLPDLDGTQPIADALGVVGGATVRHPSGRPWLLGAWRPDGVRVADAGPIRAAWVGRCLAGSADLDAALGAARHERDFHRLAAKPGSFHLAISAPGRTCLYGDVAGRRRIFVARRDGIPIASSHATALRRLLDAPLDDAWLALRLSYTGLPDAVAARAAFVGLDAVPPGQLVTIDAAGEVRTARHWWPPAPDRALIESAPSLRSALEGAVGGRVRASGPVTCDLSGGLDSAALSFLAAASGGDGLRTITILAQAADNDDADYARLAAAALPAAEHVFIDPGAIPAVGAELGSLPALDEPATFAVGIARHRHLAAIAAAHGPSWLGGHGGDEVMLAPPAHLRDSLRSHPLATVRQLRGHRALHPRTARSWLRASVASIDDYSRWLSAEARKLHYAPAGPRPDAWEAAPRLSPWVTPDAAAAARALLTDVAIDAEPAAHSVGQHAALARIRAIARVQGLLADATALDGVELEAPYLDRAVVQACLSTRPEQRTDPWRPKPLLCEALSDLLPAALLERRTKAHYTTELHDGLGRHRDELLALLEDGLLVERGLIDRRRLRDAFVTPYPVAALSETLACEQWLRTLTASRAPIRS